MIFKSNYAHFKNKTDVVLQLGRSSWISGLSTAQKKHPSFLSKCSVIYQNRDFAFTKIKVPSGTVVVAHLFVKKILIKKNLINHDI